MEKPVMKTSRLRLALCLLVIAVPALPAAALTPSCQADLDKHGTTRLSLIERINGFRKTKPTAKQACATFSELVKVEADMLKWMEDNKEWCQLPDPFVEDYRKGTTQGVKFRNQICTAAKRQATQQVAPRGPSPGSGVQLPKGAL
jgi:hypothetical protein